MQCIEILEPGAADKLVLVEKPRPVPGPDEVLIRVAAAALNWADVLQRLGKYAPPAGAPPIPGLEVSGTVDTIGSAVRDLQVGQQVCALVAGGGYAEYCAAPAAQCLPIPKGMSLTEAAAIPEAVFTVWTNVFDRARLVAGESILIHGGSSGIGTTAIQLARAFGARVFATAGSPSKCAACERLGAERAIVYKDVDFVAAVREATSGRGVDVILDMVGADYLARNIEVLAMDGRLVEIGTRSGAKAEINLGAIMQRRLTLTGSTLRGRSASEKGALARAVHDKVWPLLESGAIRPVIHATFPLREAAAAHRVMESSVHIGKLVLQVGDAS